MLYDDYDVDFNIQNLENLDDEINNIIIDIDKLTNTSQFTYPIMEQLETDYIAKIKELNLTYFNIHICPYQINTEGKNPFIQFILQKYIDQVDNKNVLLKFPVITTSIDEDILDYCFYVLDIINFCYTKSSNLFGEYIYKGFIYQNDNFYFFFDCSILNIESHILFESNDLWLASVDELLNQGNIYKFSICKNIMDFFKNNIQLTQLRDKNQLVIQTPKILYGFNQQKNINFSLIFGIHKTPGLKGLYFYFYDFCKATQQFNKYDLIRCAVFIDSNDLSFQEKNEDGVTWIITEYDKQVPLSGHLLLNHR
jgi:hypothetical protein